MNIGIWFWVLFVVGLVFFGFGLYRDRSSFAPSHIFLWILFFLLGVGTFGSPIK